MDKLLKNVLSCMRTKGLLDENEEDVYRFGFIVQKGGWCYVRNQKF